MIRTIIGCVLCLFQLLACIGADRAHSLPAISFSGSFSLFAYEFFMVFTFYLAGIIGFVLLIYPWLSKVISHKRKQKKTRKERLTEIKEQKLFDQGNSMHISNVQKNDGDAIITFSFKKKHLKLAVFFISIILVVLLIVGMCFLFYRKGYNEGHSDGGANLSQSVLSDLNSILNASTVQDSYLMCKEFASRGATPPYYKIESLHEVFLDLYESVEEVAKKIK